ncbi:MAG TPA: ATP-binding cassette domain-containing protein [Acidimicrobiales bacterium]|nr:ATP-binding cassette domain-containing protein [Acidimicrobiales bacterium]
MTGEGAGPARLEICDLAVTFGGLRAVDGVSLELSPGEVVALVGPNGSGKTTLLDAISGLVTPSAGRVVLDGEDLADMLPEERAAMGVVRSFQDARLFPELTVEDTLLLSEDGRKPSDVVSITFQLPWARRSERTKRADVDTVIESFRLGPFRQRRISHLSTGTRRVVDLASIVLARPRLLLLDEPTAGIAQREAEAFAPLLRRLQQMTGCTVLLVEHDVPLAFELCHRAVVMQTGAIVASGPPEVVRHDPLALEAYLGASEDVLRATGPLARAQPAGGLAGP